LKRNWIAVGLMMAVASSVPALVRGVEEDAPSHFLKALEFADQGDIEAAIAEMRRARELDPSAPAIPLELARLLLEARKLQEAEEAAESVVGLDAAHAEAHWLLGQSRMLQSREEDALPALQKAFELEPHERSYRMSYLLALESVGRAPEALDLLLPQKGGIEPDTPYLYLRRGILRTRMGAPAEALDDILKCIELSPGFPGAADHLLSVCWRLGPSPLTASACQRALTFDPSRADVRRELARILILLNRPEEAVPHLETLLTADPQDASIPMQLGVIRFGQERLPDAIALFRKAGVIDADVPDAGDWLWRALSRADSVEAAYAVAQEMVRRQPDNPAAHWYAANSLARLGRVEDSLRSLGEVLDEDPNHREARLLSAVLLDEAGRRDEARGHLKHILDAHPEDRETLFRLGVLEERAGRYPEALEWFRKLLVLRPDDAMALNYAGYMCAERGIELEQALEWTLRAVTLEAENAAYRDSYGWALYRLGRFPEAVAELERARRGAPEEVEIALHLAKAYRAADRTEEGREVLRRVLDGHPEERQAQELLQLWERGAPGGGNPR
jgi:tetratricopeptide (TPR) repeat protein